MFNFEKFKLDGLKYDIYRHRNKPVCVIDNVDIEDFEEQYLAVFLDQLEGEILIALHKEASVMHVICVSHTNYITAIEFVDFLFDTYGIIKGDSFYAEGKISLTMLKMCMTEKNVETEVNYFLEGANRYFDEVRNIVAATYISNNPGLLEAMDTYVKKHISWAYVRSTKIAPVGTVLRIRSLENDAGVLVTVAEDVYIMIGIRGEVYDITKDKFDAQYMESMETLDVFEKFFDFIPEVEIEGSMEFKAIDEMARLCYPRNNSKIKAAELQYRTKVFRKGKPDYFVGKPGDYLAVRLDDPTDIYIIQNEVFNRTYEKYDNN